MNMNDVIFCIARTVNASERTKPAYLGIYNRFFKRLLDLFLGLVLMVFAIPVYLIIGIAIIIDDGFPVFYRAQRGGYKGKPFRILKFRTMVKNADKIGGGTTAMNDPRITRAP